MRTVSMDEIAKWARENEQNIFMSAMTPKPKEESANDGLDIPTWNNLNQTKAKKKWYHKEPKSWFKPIFKLLVHMRKDPFYLLPHLLGAACIIGLLVICGLFE